MVKGGHGPTKYHLSDRDCGTVAHTSHAPHTCMYIAQLHVLPNKLFVQHSLIAQKVLNGKVDSVDDIHDPQHSTGVHHSREHGKGSVVFNQPPRGMNGDLNGRVWSSGTQNYRFVVFWGRRGTDQNLCVCV